MESYRSGHNEAVLKTVWVQAHGGSNPSLSAKTSLIRTEFGLDFFVVVNRNYEGIRTRALKTRFAQRVLATDRSVFQSTNRIDRKLL